jgi:hypothetical protein
MMPEARKVAPLDKQWRDSVPHQMCLRKPMQQQQRRPRTGRADKDFSVVRRDLAASEAVNGHQDSPSIPRYRRPRPAVDMPRRMGDWKAGRPRPSAPLELYHLARDVGESTDVPGAHPEVVARIEAYLAFARTATTA